MKVMKIITISRIVSLLERTRFNSKYNLFSTLLVKKKTGKEIQILKENLKGV
jgi:hypothetical protein